MHMSQYYTILSVMYLIFNATCLDPPPVRCQIPHGRNKIKTNPVDSKCSVPSAAPSRGKVDSSFPVFCVGWSTPQRRSAAMTTMRCEEEGLRVSEREERRTNNV